MGDAKILKEIGSRINKRRKELDLTQEKLAEKMDVSVQMISNLERGKKAIRPENLILLCKSLNTSADYILFGEVSSNGTDDLSEKINCLSEKDKRLMKSIIERLLVE